MGGGSRAGQLPETERLSLKYVARKYKPSIRRKMVVEYELSLIMGELSVGIS